MTEERKICPIMSDSGGFVLCQRERCYAAYPKNLMGEVMWICEIIEGTFPDRVREND